jgi:hypothetical protein
MKKIVLILGLCHLQSGKAMQNSIQNLLKFDSSDRSSEEIWVSLKQLGLTLYHLKKHAVNSQGVSQILNNTPYPQNILALISLMEKQAQFKAEDFYTIFESETLFKHVEKARRRYEQEFGNFSCKDMNECYKRLDGEWNKN